MLRPMTHADAVTLLELARQARWDFPTSSGRPVRGEPTGAVARLVEARARLGDAVVALEPELATELAARSWRLWVLAKDVPGGRDFLALVVDLPTHVASGDRAGRGGLRPGDEHRPRVDGPGRDRRGDARHRALD